MHNNLLNRIQQLYDEFSKGQKLIANYISAHYDKAAFMTAAKLGDVVGVSESTVVRFAIEMGYDGYPKFQKELRELIKSKLTAVQRMEVSSQQLNENNILKSVLQSDMEKLKNTLEEINTQTFNEVVECILKAKRIYIIGVRSSATLAGFFSFYLNLILDNVRLVSTASISEIFEQILNVGDGDLVMGISFPRYSRRTIKAMQFAKDQGANVVTITDSFDSPLAEFADLALIARSDMASFVDSLVAPLSVINAIIVALGMKKKDQVYQSLDKLEKIWDEYQVYANSDVQDKNFNDY